MQSPQHPPSATTVACVDADVRDGYANTLSRSSACYDTGKSVVITVTDSCPC